MTGKIKKIISIENGDNYVADIEEIENRITQNSSNLESAKQELSNKCNEALSQAKAYTDQEKAKLFNSTNGTFTGQEYFRNSDEGVLRFNGGNTHDGGASLMLFGKNATASQGVFDLVACTKEDSSDSKQLIGTPAGTLTWAGHEVERVELKTGNYIRFASGLTLMWGQVDIPAGTKKYTVNLPIPFKSDYIVSLTNLAGINANYGSTISYQILQISLSAFNILHTLESSTGWAYFAVGY